MAFSRLDNLPKHYLFIEIYIPITFLTFPVSNPGINYDPVKDVGSGCVEYKKYEWENEMTPNVLINWNNEIQ